MNAIRPCPPPQVLRALADGLLAAAEEVPLAAHLDTCEECRRVLEGLSHTVQDQLRLDLSATTAPLADSLRRAMSGMKAVGPEAFAAPGFFAAGAGPEPSYEGWLGPYEVQGVIGRGGMGVVMRAFDPSLHRLVAIKVLAPHLAHNLAARRRFAREGRAAAAVSHEHVVAVHGVHEADGVPYLVMEYVPGISLQERLDRDGPLDVPAVLRIGIQVAAGLAAAHAQGLIHRDIKPANILLENEIERVKITDFGLARAADDASMTQSGLIAGTPQYMAPEQARGETIDPRADLFSLGSVLYAACTGRPPFHAVTTLGVLHRICTEEPDPIRDLNPDVPEWLSGVIAILHAKDRARRFASAAEVARLLGQCLIHLENPSVQPAPPTLAWRAAQVRQRRRPWRRALAAVAIVLLLAGLLAWPFLHWMRPYLSAARTPETARGQGVPAVHIALPQLRGNLEHPAPVFAAAFTPDGIDLATACGDHAIRLWDHRARRLRQRLDGHQECVWSLAYSPKRRLLASAAGDWFRPADSGEVILWDLAKGEPWRNVSRGSALFFSVAFAPDGNTLAAASWDGRIHLWDPDADTESAVLRGHTAPVRSIAFSPDGKLLASGGFDGRVCLWDVATRQRVAEFRNPAWKVNALAFSPDGALLAVAENPADDGPTRAGQVRLLDIAAQWERAVLHGPRGRVLSVRFSPDGKKLVSGGGDWDRFGEVLLWDTATLGEPARLSGPPQWVESVVFSPDGTLLVTAGGTTRLGGELRLWEFPANLPAVSGLFR